MSPTAHTPGRTTPATATGTRTKARAFLDRVAGALDNAQHERRRRPARSFGVAEQSDVTRMLHSTR